MSFIFDTFFYACFFSPPQSLNRLFHVGFYFYFVRIRTTNTNISMIIVSEEVFEKPVCGGGRRETGEMYVVVLHLRTSKKKKCTRVRLINDKKADLRSAAWPGYRFKNKKPISQ